MPARPGAVRAWLDKTPDRWSPPTATDLSGPFRYLFWLIRSQVRQIALGTTLGTVWMIGLAIPPWVLSKIVDRGLVPRNPTALIEWSLLLLGVGVVNALLGVARHRTMTKIRMDALFRSVRATVQHTARLGASLSRQVSAGEVVTVGIGDVQTVSTALTVTGPGIGAVIAYVVVAGVLFTISPLLAVVVLGGVPVLAVVVGPLLRRIEHTTGDYRLQQARLTTRLVDALAGLRVLNGLGGKDFIAERYDRQSGELVARGYRVAGPASWVGALAGGLPALFLAVVVWLSARLAVVGTISIGDVVAVYGYVAMLVVPVANFIEGAGDIARARVAGRRIVDLLNLSIPHENDHEAGHPPSSDGLLSDNTCGVIVRPGLLTVIVAARPAEAARLIDRLGRADADSSAPPMTLNSVEFRHRVLVADNDAELFAGTVREVVAGRLPPDDTMIITAIAQAVATDVVQALPGGLDAPIAAGGHNLSGGQRQRIRWARALYARPQVLLAVDPTSAVDANTEATMIDNLRDARREQTTVITTTSPLVLDRADEVIMIADGRAAAVGTHAELLRDNADYRDLVSRTTTPDGQSVE